MGKLGKGAVSCIYRSLIVNGPNRLSALRWRWQTWVGVMDDEDWTMARMAPRELAIPARLRMIQINYLYLAYLTPPLHPQRPPSTCAVLGESQVPNVLDAY